MTPSATGSILVTGASTGIGEACALAFDRLGWEVFAGVRRPEDGKELEAKATGRLRPLLLDVTDLPSVEAAADQIAGVVGDAGLTAVVNNAGIAVGGPVEYITVEQWRRQFEVNVIGQMAVTRAVLPVIRRSGRPGRIVFMGSIGGRVASPFIAPYSASKHAIEAIAESMRHELADTDIATVVIEPGAVRTPIWDKAESDADDIEAALPAEGRARYGPAIAGLRKAMAFQARTGVDPAVVAGVVIRAVTSERPAARYLVGRDAKVMAVAARLLPDRARDVVMAASVKLVSR
jgi:NAD(P)-dependent dehydrogenase (short-subunit alcohol dehydrogenase family)